MKAERRALTGCDAVERSGPMRPEELATRLEALHDAAFGWARACCRGDADLAREVLQVSYVKVLDGRAVYEGRSSLRTWLFGVIRRTAAEQRRRRWLPRLREHAASQGADPAPAATPADDLSARERREQTRRALMHLSRRQREILHLVFYEELTVEQAAEILDLGVGSARVHYARGKERMRRMLEPEATP